MLRTPRRDRFAPSVPCERERRLLGFGSSGSRDTQSGSNENVDSRSEGPSPTEATRQVLDGIAKGTHFSAEAIVSDGSMESLATSNAVLDAMEEIAHPTPLMTRALEEGKNVQAILEVLKDPSSLITLIRQLTQQKEKYQRLIDSLSISAASGLKINQNERAALSREDTATSIRERMKLLNINSPEEWIAQAKPGEIEKLLGTRDKPSALQRLTGILHDAWNRARYRSGKLSTSTPNAPEKDQANYFSLVENNLQTLKRALKRNLEEQANRVTNILTADIRHGLAETAGISEGELGSVDSTTWDETASKAFEAAHGVTLEDVFHEANAVSDITKRARGIQIGAPDFTEKSEQYISQMQEVEATAHSDGLWNRAIEQAKQRHAETTAWTQPFLASYERILPRLSEAKVADFLAKSVGARSRTEFLEQLKGIAEMLRNPSAIDRSELSMLRASTTRLPQLFEYALAQEFHSTFELTDADSAPDRFDDTVREATRSIEEAEQLLTASRIQNSHACHIAGIPEKLAEQVRSARGHIARATADRDQARAALAAFDTSPGGKSADERTELQNELRTSTARVAVARKQMQEISKGLRFIATRIPEHASPTDHPCKGFCNYGKPEYFVNAERHRNPPPSGPIDQEELKRTADHEFGHLVIDTLTERVPVLTGFFDQKIINFRDTSVELGGITAENLEKTFESAAKSWGLNRDEIIREGDSIHARGGGESYYHRKRFEELLMQYATYKNRKESIGSAYDIGADPYFSSEDVRTLIRLLDAGEIPQQNNALWDTAMDKREEVSYSGLGSGNDPNEDEDEKKKGEEGPKPIIEEFKSLRGLIGFIGEFISAFPQGTPDELKTAHHEATHEYDVLFKMFSERVDEHGHKLPNDFDTDELREPLERHKRTLTAWKEEIQKFDSNNMASVSEAPPGQKEMWLWATRDIQWLSIMDYVTIAKESWEDLGRLWKRRGENARGKVGELLTGWIPDKTPYLGQLKHEFHRRQQSSEQEAVGVWEKALENVDSYKLIEDLPHVNNQDHLKAVMILLTKRGRLDWDDPDVWRALSRFSHFKIPEHECHRDPVLLEKWLQKVITDIWSDKDLYRTWKTTNEHSYDSERDKYNGIADYYSATGNLRPQLAYMLKTFVEVKKAQKLGKAVQMPDQVNPHLYEKLFLYAMENGKMTMKDKFFYLVQGLRYQLIPIDRVSIIQGKVAMEGFPFIDFFYQQNNSMADITEISDSITEDPPNDPFEPGLKSVAFLMEEVARDEMTRARVSKYMDRKGDTLDHEDVPMFVAFVGFNDMNSMLQPMGGQKQRLTAEGIKNAYVGYNTLFKSNAMRLKKMIEDGQKPSRDDLQYLVSRLVAYTHFNNVVLREAAEVSGRPTLGYEAYKNSTMPSASNGLKPKDYGEQMNTFADRLIKKYGITLSTPGVDINEYLGKDAGMRDGERNEKSFEKASPKAKEVFGATKEMYNVVFNAVLADNGAGLVEVLTGMDDSFINEGDSQFSYADMQKNANRVLRRYAHAPTHGGH